MSMKVSNDRKYEVRPDLYYHPDSHMWISVDGNRAVVGLEPMELEAKGAIVVIQFEKTGSNVESGGRVGSIEAEKHVGVLVSPVSGRLIVVNHTVTENPRIVTDDPYDAGWLFEIEMSSFDSEKDALITGPEVLTWYDDELRRFEAKGWLAIR